MGKLKALTEHYKKMSSPPPPAANIPAHVRAHHEHVQNTVAALLLNPQPDNAKHDAPILREEVKQAVHTN